jgi:hypothetical protein
MRYANKNGLASLLVLSLLFSACTFGQEPEPTPDVGAIFTAAAETVQAQFAIQLTQTAQAAPTSTIPPLPPTATPISFPTFAIGGSPAAPATTPLVTVGVGTQAVAIPTLVTATPLAVLATQPEQLCMDSAFITDVNYPDGTVVEENTRIVKSWQIQNTGTCIWDDGFTLRPVTGEAMEGKPWEIKLRSDFVDPDEIVNISVEMKTPSTGGEHGGCWRMQGDNGQYFGTFMCILITVE